MKLVKLHYQLKYYYATCYNCFRLWFKLPYVMMSLYFCEVGWWGVTQQIHNNVYMSHNI